MIIFKVQDAMLLLDLATDGDLSAFAIGWQTTNGCQGSIFVDVFVDSSFKYEKEHTVMKSGCM